MKILYVTHKLFYPVAGGDCIRMSQMLEGLLQLGEVDVMYIAHPGEGGSLMGGNPAVASEWSLEVGRPRRLARALSTLFNRRPLLVNLYRYNSFRRRLLSVAHGYDRVVLGGLGVAHYCVDLEKAGVDVYLDLTDSAAMNLDNEVNMSSGIRRIWHKINAARMRRLEARWRDVCRATAFISDVDRGYLVGGQGRQVIVGNKVDLCDKSLICQHDSCTELLFVGRMDYAPNILAVKRFVKNVLPRITASRSDVVFRIVGASPGEEIKRLAVGNRNVVVEGFVDSLDSYYASASVVVAPMFSGSGIQNKILQAMAAGCCVVTTPIGAEGLDMDSGAFALARNDSELATVCLRLLADPLLRCAYGLAAREYVASHFSSDAMVSQISDFLSAGIPTA